jgi:hypothetical protein
MLAEEITLTLAGKRIILRPSLRAAMRLERRGGSFASLARELFEGSLTASADVLRDHVAWSDDLLHSRIMEAGLDNLKPALIAFVFACSGIPDEELSDDTAKGESAQSPVSFADHLAGLYRIATGWIGWPPEVALDATPAEITEAYKGRVDMLKAIFGGNSEEAPSGGDWGEKLQTAAGAKNVVKFERAS